MYKCESCISSTPHAISGAPLYPLNINISFKSMWDIQKIILIWTASMVNREKSVRLAKFFKTSKMVEIEITPKKVWYLKF